MEFLKNGAQINREGIRISVSILVRVGVLRKGIFLSFNILFIVTFTL